MLYNEHDVAIVCSKHINLEYNSVQYSIIEMQRLETGKYCCHNLIWPIVPFRKFVRLRERASLEDSGDQNLILVCFAIFGVDVLELNKKRSCLSKRG